MGAAVKEEVKVGSIVWVRRRNGIWWPGRVMAPADFTPLPDRHFFGTPVPPQIKLLGQNNATLDNYNLETTKRVKAFRCGEFDDCIRKIESSRDFGLTKDLKCTRRKNAILHALDLERQLVQKKLKRPGSELQQETCSRVKRSKYAYFSSESGDCLKKSVQSRSLKDSKKSSEFSAVDKTASSGRSEKLKPERKLNIQEVCMGDVGPDDRSCVFYCKGDAAIPLFDVNIKVEATHQGVNVPLVSMMSRLNGKAIIGHPVNIEVLEGAAETEIRNGEKSSKKKLSGTCPLVWKTSKRTPVIYSSPLPSSRRKGASSRTEESFPLKSCKRQTSSSNWSRNAFSGDNLRPTVQKAMKGEALLKSVGCVPVKHIFSELLAAVAC
ncbi:unnamed protein product [Cuscuta europaea]|uniref:PWWP domain-containing protein n=1 Tax=Cuscuta europaea TaxID=41803 RepID=A0A9P0YXL9_CUSEU|nr:unnamed protein product [Cuscuta europaea]